MTVYDSAVLKFETETSKKDFQKVGKELTTAT